MLFINHLLFREILYVWVGILLLSVRCFGVFKFVYILQTPQVQLNSPVVMSTGPAELGVHLRKQNLADVHLLYPNRVGADLAIPLLFVPPPAHFSILRQHCPFMVQAIK